MPSSLERSRVLLATSLMLEMIAYKQDKSWFDGFRNFQFDEEDLQITFLFMFQNEQESLPQYQDYIMKSPEQKKRLKLRFRAIDYALGVRIIRMWDNLNLSNKRPLHRVKYYLTNVEAQI